MASAEMPQTLRGEARGLEICGEYRTTLLMDGHRQCDQRVLIEIRKKKVKNPQITKEEVQKIRKFCGFYYIRISKNFRRGPSKSAGFAENRKVWSHWPPPKPHRSFLLTPGFLPAEKRVRNKDVTTCIHKGGLAVARSKPEF